MVLNIDQLATNQLGRRGHTEKTTAILQAMIELNFFCPPPLRMRNRDNKLKAIEHYWEANVPRAGEEGHISWTEWFMSQGTRGDFFYKNKDNYLCITCYKKCAHFSYLNILRKLIFEKF